MPELVSDSVSGVPAKRSLVHLVIGRRIVRFAAVGALSTLIDFGIYNLSLMTGLNVYVAGAFGFLAGFANGYFLNSRFVFKKFSQNRATKYFLISVVGLALTELILHITHVEMGLAVNVSKLIAVAVVFFWNYSLSKYWAFQ